MKRKIAAAAVILLLSASLSDARIFWSENAATEALWRIFEDIELNGATDTNTAELERFIYTYPAFADTDEAVIRIASIFADKKDFRRAATFYQMLLEDFPASPHKMEALYGLGYCQYRNGMIMEAKSNLESVVSTPNTSLTLRVKAQILLDAIESIISTLKQEADRPAIGAVLPLNGLYAAFGDDALKGILLAVEEFVKKGGMDIEVRVKDSGSRDVSAEELAEQLLRDDNVMGIVGPLLSRTAPAVARTTQSRMVPAIVLSQRDGIPETGDFVFRNFLTPKQQAETIAEYAIDTEGLKSFAILYPDNTYGRDLAYHFRNAVMSRGGTIAGEAKYAPGKKDFGKELKALFDIKVERRLVGRRLVAEYTPGIEVQALYIPDYYASVAQIAPYLAYYNIKDVVLLGSNGWNSPELIELAGEYVEGAVFVDGFFPRSNRKGTSDFVRRFKKVYGYEPGIIEAEAYDSAMIMLAAIAQNATDRLAVRDIIEKTEIPDGATGRIHFDEYGDAVKELFLLKVEDGRIIEVETLPDEGVSPVRQ